MTAIGGKRSLGIPTLPGVMSVLMAVALALVSLRVSNPWLLLIGCAMFAPMVISQVLPANLGSISIGFRGPNRIGVGELIEQQFRAHNSGTRTTPQFRLTHAHPGFAPVGIVVPPLPPGAHAELTLDRTAITRSVSSEHRLRLRTTAPFGLVVRRRDVTVDARISVHPAAGPVAEPIGPSRGDLSRGRVTRVGEQPHALREWQRGDALRQVHWRATARHDRLTVVIPEATVHPRLALVIAGAATDDEWEQLLSTAASTAVETARSGRRPVRLSANGMFDYIGNDPDAVLDWFAALPAVPPPSPDLIRAAADWAGADGVVMLAGTRTPAVPTLAGDRVVVLLPDGSVLDQ